MEYCKKELGSYNIHFIQSTSFKNNHHSGFLSTTNDERKYYET